MRQIADLHLHSKHARGTSGSLNLEELNRWGKIKGIDILATGDFTHPVWFAEIKAQLEPLGNGFFRYRLDPSSKVQFILSVEISSIYSKGGRVYRIHNIVLLPSLESAAKLNLELGKLGNLSSDGRPILGLDSEVLAKIVLNVEPQALIIPAHIWTPWFSLFGSNSGFDSLEGCFGQMSPYIYAVETGLSSDPPMNWRLSSLDRLAILSNSDAHSGPNLAREANIFAMENPSYDELYQIIKNNDSRLKATIEFYPEEGKYHYDGHRNCGVRFNPFTERQPNDICPKCGKKLTVGVMHRVEDLADRPPLKERPANRPEVVYLVGLQKIIAETLGVLPGSKKVVEEYFRLINLFGDSVTSGSELKILLDTSLEDLAKNMGEKIVEGIKRVRENKISVDPGYDGVFGKVSVFGEKPSTSLGQASLFG